MKLISQYQVNLEKSKIVYEQYNELTHEKSTLTGVVDGSISWNMNTDTKAQASIETEDDNYQHPNKILISLDTPDGVVKMGYYDVYDVSETKKPGMVVRKYELNGVINRIKEFYTDREIKGSDTGNFVYQMQKALHYDPNKPNLVWDTPDEQKSFNFDYGIAESSYTIFSDLLQRFDYTASTPDNFSGNFNTLKLVKYVNPDTKEPVFTFGENNETIEGLIDVSLEMYKVPNYIIAKHTFDDVEQIRTAKADASLPVSVENTRVYKMKVYDENTLTPETLEELQNRANTHLAKDCKWKNKYEFTGYFVGVFPADTVNLIYQDELKKCVVESMDITLSPSLKTKYIIQETDASITYS